MEKGSTKSIYRFFQLFLSNILSPLARRGGPTLAPCLIPFTNCQEQTFALCLTKQNLKYERITHWHLPGGPFLELKATWFRDSLWSLRDSLGPINSRKNQITAICNFNFCWDPKPFLTVDGWNPANQLRLVLYPIVYMFFYTSQVVVWDFWTINSIICKLFCPKISISIDEWRPKAPAASNLRVFFSLMGEDR